MHNPLIASLMAFALAVVPSVVAAQDASSPTYRQDFIVGPDGKPSLQITNDSESPIVAFVRVDFSSGLEGRTYYDAYTSPRDQPISQGGSVSLHLGPNRSKVPNQVQAVVLEDGSSAGGPSWINTIFARRLRLYDRLLSLHDLLKQQVGKGFHAKQSWTNYGPLKRKPTSNCQMMTFASWMIWPSMEPFRRFRLPKCPIPIESSQHI